MDYTVVFFDLDGTAFPNGIGNGPSARLINVIERLRGKVRLCAATGRPLVNCAHVLRALQVTDPCVVSAGTQVADPVSGKIFWEKSIDQVDLDRLLVLCKPHDYLALVDGRLVENGAEVDQIHQQGRKFNAVYINRCGDTESRLMLDEIATIPGLYAIVVPSFNGPWNDIHVMSSSASKGHAATWLLEQFGASKQQAIGVGDSDNDIDLFGAVGRRVAMGNSSARLRSIADEVCGSVNDDGLAELLEQLLETMSSGS